MNSNITKISVGLGALVALQLANFLFVQPNHSVQCTDKAGATHTFRLSRDFTTLGGRCQGSDVPAGADCHRELEKLGAEGGMCTRES